MVASTCLHPQDQALAGWVAVLSFKLAQALPRAALLQTTVAALDTTGVATAADKRPREKIQCTARSRSSVHAAKSTNLVVVVSHRSSLQEHGSTLQNTQILLWSFRAGLVCRNMVASRTCHPEVLLAPEGAFVVRREHGSCSCQAQDVPVLLSP